MVSDGAREKLYRYDYPGNVRELQNIIMAAVSMAEDEHVLTEDDLQIGRILAEPFYRPHQHGLPANGQKLLGDVASHPQSLSPCHNDDIIH